jgi:hypothetical protein
MLADLLLQHLNDAKPQCMFGKWLVEQEDEIQDLFNQLMKKEKKNISAIWSDLNSTGVPFKASTFKTHMRGDCSCPKQ